MSLKTFAVVVGKSIYFLLGLLVDVDLSTSVEFGSPCLSPLPFVGVRVVEVGVFLAVLMHSLWVFLSCQRNYTAHFTVVLQVSI